MRAAVGHVRDAREDEAPPPTIEMLYASEAPRLLRYFRRWTGLLADAEDLTHQTFVRLSGAQGYKAGSLDAPAPYLSRIARNLLRDRRRAELRKGDMVALEETALPAPDPHPQLEARDMLRRLEQALTMLPPKTREIFLAHRLDGLTYIEIAARTGLSVKGVEKQMSKAIHRLRRTMGPV